MRGVGRLATLGAQWVAGVLMLASPTIALADSSESPPQKDLGLVESVES